MQQFLDDLQRLLQAPTCLVGIGNEMRRDDGVGPHIAEALKSDLKPGNQLRVVNAEDIPEAYVISIADSDVENVLLVDALAVGQEPGTVVFGAMEEFDQAAGGSTHHLSLELCGRILEEHGKRVYLLGVVPEITEFGTGLSRDVAEAAEGVIQALRDCRQVNGGVS